jgi:hypothetical protein
MPQGGPGLSRAACGPGSCGAVHWALADVTGSRGMGHSVADENYVFQWLIVCLGGPDTHLGRVAA